MRIPVSNPKLGQVESAYLNSALISGRITQGPMVDLFEEMLRNHFGHDVHAIACSSGTAALHLALASYDFNSDCEILVPDLTYIASANAVSYTGARVVLVDVDPKTWTIDINDCKRKISNSTVAILPVHLYGMPCNMDDVMNFADEHELFVIEDAAEALGASYAGVQCGLHGNAGCFSFYGNKLITTGEGGAVITHDENLAEEVRLRRGQGQSKDRRFFHEVIGYNYRMTDLQAAVGVAQMSQLQDFILARNNIFKQYDSLLDMSRPRVPSSAHVVAPWLYTLALDSKQRRDDVATLLEREGIETRPVFVPLHRQPMYERPDSQFPISSQIADRGISLPTYVGLEPEDVARIAGLVNSCLAAKLRIAKG